MVGIVSGALYVGASKLVVFMKVRPTACQALSVVPSDWLDGNCATSWGG